MAGPRMLAGATGCIATGPIDIFPVVGVKLCQYCKGRHEKYPWQDLRQ